MVDVPAEAVDEISVQLFELGAQGVEERDATTLAKGAVGLVTLVAAFAARDEAEAAVAELAPSFVPRVEEVIGDAWRDAWKDFYRPFYLTPSVLVRPPWQEAPEGVAPGVRVLELEPGRAFGTGLHATTALVARALESNARVFAGREVLDVGTGSGILAIAALALGASRAVAVDNDPEAVKTAVENASRNGLGSRLDASTADVASLGGAYPFVVANIETPVLVPLAPAIGARVAPGGVLVLSGILDGQQGEIARAYASFGRASLARDGEWVSMTFGAP